MARPRTEFRNELKTRVPDPVYDGVKAFQAENGIDSESRAISKLLEIALFGTVGTMPITLSCYQFCSIWRARSWLVDTSPIFITTHFLAGRASKRSLEFPQDEEQRCAQK